VELDISSGQRGLPRAGGKVSCTGWHFQMTLSRKNSSDMPIAGTARFNLISPDFKRPWIITSRVLGNRFEPTCKKWSHQWGGESPSDQVKPKLTWWRRLLGFFFRNREEPDHASDVPIQED